jgi:hypothetical protein
MVRRMMLRYHEQATQRNDKIVFWRGAQKRDRVFAGSYRAAAVTERGAESLSAVC